MTQQQEQQIINLDYAGKSVRAISKVIGISKSQIHRFLKRLDAEELKEQEAPKECGKKQDENIQQPSYNQEDDPGFPWVAVIALLFVIGFLAWIFFRK